jgi:hypothetical protein
MLCGLSTNNNNNNCFKNITEGNAPVDPIILPDAIYKFLISVTEHVFHDNALNDLTYVSESLIVSEYTVFNLLKYLKMTKSVCDEFLVIAL